MKWFAYIIGIMKSMSKQVRTAPVLIWISKKQNLCSMTYERTLAHVVHHTVVLPWAKGPAFQTPYSTVIICGLPESRGLGVECHLLGEEAFISQGQFSGVRGSCKSLGESNRSSSEWCTSSTKGMWNRAPIAPILTFICMVTKSGNK